MATKIRLQRHGKKKAAFFHIVVADARAKRDGKFIEKIGTYNPTSNPATIDIEFDRALYWVKTGAVPTDTARAILSYKGVLMKSHLDKGVVKGALTQDAADKKFEAWMKEKEAKITGKVDSLSKAAEAALSKQLADEKAKNEAKAAAIAAKDAPEVEETPAAEVAEEAPAAEVAEEAPAAEVTEEAPAAEVTEEAPAAEVTEEAPAAEVAEEAPAAEVTEEAPAADEASEEKAEEE